MSTTAASNYYCGYYIVAFALDDDDDDAVGAAHVQEGHYSATRLDGRRKFRIDKHGNIGARVGGEVHVESRISDPCRGKYEHFTSYGLKNMTVVTFLLRRLSRLTVVGRAEVVKAHVKSFAKGLWGDVVTVGAPVHARVDHHLGIVRLSSSPV